MTDTWYTHEVIRCLTTDADMEEIQELLEEAEDEAAEVLEKWVRQGNAPKSLYDALLRFSDGSDKAFRAVDWEAVSKHLQDAF